MTRAGSGSLWVVCGNQRPRAELAVDPTAHKRTYRPSVQGGFLPQAAIPKAADRGRSHLRNSELHLSLLKALNGG